MASLIRTLASLVVPDRCALCAAWLTPRERGLCAGCADDVSGVVAPPPDGVDLCLGAAPFVGDLRASVLRMKYQREGWRARGLAALLLAAPDVRRHVLDADGVCHAPTSAARRAARGFDQAARIAGYVARDVGTPFAPGLLQRAEGHAAQTGRARAERADTAHRVEAVDRIAGVWVVIDDVVTTGATFAGCARALRQAGAAGVVALAVGVTPAPGSPRAALLDAADTPLVR